MGMPPFIGALVSQIAKAPGFQETLDRANQFISSVDLRLAAIQAAQTRIEENQAEMFRQFLKGLHKGENDGR